jgi:hypothetical protein
MFHTFVAIGNDKEFYCIEIMRLTLDKNTSHLLLFDLLEIQTEFIDAYTNNIDKLGNESVQNEQENRYLKILTC